MGRVGAAGKNSSHEVFRKKCFWREKNFTERCIAATTAPTTATTTAATTADAPQMHRCNHRCNHRVAIVSHCAGHFHILHLSADSRRRSIQNNSHHRSTTQTTTSAAGAQKFSPQADSRLLHRMPDDAGTQPSLLVLERRRSS